MADRYDQDRERYGRDRGQEHDRGREEWRGEGSQFQNAGYYGREGRQGMYEGRERDPRWGREPGRGDYYRGENYGTYYNEPRGNSMERDFDRGNERYFGRDFNRESGRENYFAAGGPNQGGRYEDQNEWSSRRGAWSGAEGPSRGMEAGRYAQGGSYYGGMGQFGGGMSQYGEQGRYSGRGPRGYKRSDDRIKEDVSERLTIDPWVDASEIEIEVKDGEVTLTGFVESRDEKRRAEDTIDRVSGVHEVHNQLRVQHQGATVGSGQNTGSSRQQGSPQQGSQTGKTSGASAGQASTSKA